MVRVEKLGATLVAGGQVARFSAGMAMLRLKRLALQRPGLPRGNNIGDPLADAVELRAGDEILDCTLGLAADALVLASVAARVVGLEASPALAAFAAAGLPALAEPAGAAGRRIEVRCADHRAFLAAAAPRSFDVVFFDPMFRHARPAAGAFDGLRALADVRPLDAATLALARRVARRSVVVKDGAPGLDLARLGLRTIPTRRGAQLLYARVPAAE